MNFIQTRQLTRTAFLNRVKALNITPVELDISLLDNNPKVLSHHNYPLTKPIIVRKRKESDKLYSVRDGNHRVQQAKELGNATILAIIAPNPWPVTE